MSIIARFNPELKNNNHSSLLLLTIILKLALNKAVFSFFIPQNLTKIPFRVSLLNRN